MADCGSSAKGVRKNLIARGQDEASIKANRAEIDEIVGSTLFAKQSEDGGIKWAEWRYGMYTDRSRLAGSTMN